MLKIKSANKKPKVLFVNIGADVRKKVVLDSSARFQVTSLE